MEVLSEKLHCLEVLSKEIGILTSFGPIQPFMGIFVMSKKTGLSGTVVINSIFHGTVLVFVHSVMWKDGQNLAKKQ